MDRNMRRTLDLFLMFTGREITLKYKRSYLGFIWSLMNPILTALVFFVAFKLFMRFEIEDYTLFMLSALFPWTWFSASVSMCIHSLTGNISLIKKIIFPKRLLVVSVITGQMVTLLISIPILAVLLYYYGKSPYLSWLYIIPILLTVQFFIILGISMALAMLNAYFRDMEHITNVTLNMLFWMTPVMYPLAMVPEKYRIFLAMNPMTYLIQSWRDVIMTGRVNWVNVLIAAVTAAVCMLLGSFIFAVKDKKLDEVL
ncbi:MAG TPA: ABC transporter permease [Candidatus Goldiibacteriota bacterium]|mgnify:CR=1 FL=1|nr:ABC transporter permease [Candidatus Goldiibacteriota bacterium]